MIQLKDACLAKGRAKLANDRPDLLRYVLIAEGASKQTICRWQRERVNEAEATAKHSWSLLRDTTRHSERDWQVVVTHEGGA
jgi:hypothetical protein